MLRSATLKPQWSKYGLDLKNGDLTNPFELLGRGDGVKKKVNQFAIKFMSAITDTGAK